MLDDLDSIHWAALHNGHGTAEHLPENLRKLMSDDPADWAAAIDALNLTIFDDGRYWAAIPHVIAFLIRLAGSTEIKCRAEVLELLADVAGNTSKKDSEFGLIHGQDARRTPEHRKGMVELLAWAREERVAFLQGWRMFVDFLADPDPGIRVSAGYVLGKIGRSPPEDWPVAVRQAGAAARITAALRRAVSSEPDELVKAGHVFAIAALADHDPDTVEVLREQLAAPSSPGVELAAAMSLVERGGEVPIEAIGLLVRLMVNDVEYWTVFEDGRPPLRRFPWLVWPDRELGSRFDLIKILCRVSPRYLDRILPAFLFALGNESPYSVNEVSAPILGYLFGGGKLPDNAGCVDLTPPQRAALEILFEREALFTSPIGNFRGLVRSMGLSESRWKWERFLDKPGWRTDTEQHVLANLDRFVRHSANHPASRPVTDADRRGLKFLNLDGIVDADAYMPYLFAFPNLEVLRLGASGITNDGLRAMPAFRRLKEIYLFGNPITDEGLVELGRMPTLEVVGVEGSGISDGGVKILAESLPRLLKAGLIAPRITDQGMKTLAASLPLLRELRLYGTAITESAVPWLARLTRLEKLDLRGTSLSGDAVDRLRRSLPNCWILQSK
jgi:hypothetical protein